MKKLMAAALAIAVALTACSTKNMLTVTESKDALGQPILVTEYTLTDTGIYHKSIADSTRDKRLLAEKQAEEIRSVDISSQSTDAQALLNRDKITSIGSIAVTPYEGKAPVTGGDIGLAVASVAPALITGGVAAVGIMETGKTFRSAIEKDSVVVKDSKDTSITISNEDNDQTQVATAAADGSASNAPQSKGSTAGAASDSGVTGDSFGEDAALIAQCKDSHAGTTFACVNTTLGTQKYGVTGNDITKNGSNWMKVDAFEGGGS